MSVTIRVDDFPGTKREEFYKHNMESFIEFDDVMQKNCGKQYLLGVIPTYSSHEDLVRLSTMNLQIGMHGIKHDERYQNEFLPHQTDREIFIALIENRQRLQDIVNKPVKVYMPPHNVLDVRTCRLAKDAGFTHVTTGPETDVEISYVKRLHSKKPLEYGRSDELLSLGAVDYLNRKDTQAILTLHWTWEFNIGLSHLSRFLEQIKDVVIDFRI